MPTSPTLVVLPTYQEADNIEAVLHQVRAALPEADVLVIDDASPDGTADLAEAAGQVLGRVEVNRRPGKAGLGSAYRAGAAWALERGYEVLVFMDSDLSHDPAVLPDLVGALDGHGADLVVGSRYITGGSIPDWTRRRRWLSMAGNLYVRAALGLSVRDATGGYRVWRSALVRDIDLVLTRAEGYAFVIETNRRAERQGASIVEVPIVFRDRALGRSKMSGRIIFEAIALVTLWGGQERWGRLRGSARASATGPRAPGVPPG